MKKKFITLLMAIVFIFALVGCSSGNEDKINDLYNKLSEMQQEIDSLKNDREISEQIKEITKSLSDLNDEIAAMKTQSAEWEKLQTRLESLETTVEKLVTGSEKLNSEITDLKSELDTAKARITVLEAAVNTEPVICDFGDTYTLKNNGIELFSIEFISFTGTNTETQQYSSLKIKIFNHLMPECPVSNYFCAYAVSDSTIYNYVYKSPSVIKQNDSLDTSVVFRANDSSDFPEPSILKKIYIGIATGTASDSTMIPYVILRMNNSNI